MQRSRTIGRALATSFLSAIAGSVLSTALLCAFLTVRSLGPSSTGLVALLILGIMSFFMGLLFAIPAALLIGAPLTWAIGDSVSSSKATITAPAFALIGALVGWGVFVAVGDDTSGIAQIAKIACPLYGAVVAGLHPIVARWLAKSTY
ncbi:hypothetical protein [Novosphingobium sp. PY1]|uniref:hypothetical protein n=1 Tax=Novosphingobium sp. PY1 TaxID=1882221 RepID=UPI001A90CA52|nr:hypothetical protein [Novosphingobium sp. PY1]